MKNRTGIGNAETSMNSPLWTQDEAVALECAQEVITDLISINMSAIYKEEVQPAPDAQRLATLRTEVAALWDERAHLAITEQEKIARIRSEYGGKVRAYREAQARQTAA